MSHRQIRRQRGFSLIESLIALVITAFGLLAIAGVGIKLSQSEDIARQRGEAARLAQEKIEDLRSFTQITAAAGTKSWNGLASSTDNITNGTLLDGEAYRTNTTFERSWTLLDSATDAWRRVRVTVAWADSMTGTADKQTLSYTTVISKTNPADVGSLAFPLPGNTTLKRPKNRSLNIPVPAVDLGDGTSAITVEKAAVKYSVIFSNETGYVVRLCTIEVSTASQVNDITCPKVNAYVVAGYISLSGFSTFPTGLAINTASLTGVDQSPTKTICEVKQAWNQNTNSAIANYKYYLCVLTVPSQDGTYSGMVRLAAPVLNVGTTGYTVCRFQFPAGGDANDNMRNVQPYQDVADSLDNQNYVITNANSGNCPTVDGLKTTEHQVCRSSNGNRLTDCPAL
jgi:prepilin-type N-terminal cleavage/methylation domain-containing protein